MLDYSLVSEKDKCMLMEPMYIKDIVGWDTCTISCGAKQLNETAENLSRRSEYKVSWILDNCCFVVDSSNRQYFFYTKDTVVNDVIFAKADMDEKRGRIAAVKEAV